MSGQTDAQFVCTGDQACGGDHSIRDALPGCFWERKPHPLYDVPERTEGSET